MTFQTFSQEKKKINARNLTKIYANSPTLAIVF